MFLKRIYQKDKAGALIMNSGNSVPSYKELKKLQDNFEEIKVFMTPTNMTQVLKKYNFSDEFIKKITDNKFLSVVDNKVVLTDAAFKAGVGLAVDEKPVVTQINVKQLSEKQNFTRKFIDKSLEDGFMSMIKGDIVLHTNPELTYKVVKVPGIFCCFTGVRLGDQKEARAYIADNYAGEKSPDLNNPSGYRDDRFYACELVDIKETN